MSLNLGPQFIRRASLEGALCTVRCLIDDNELPGIKGEWLGVEWDNAERGKHDGTYKGKRYFSCQSAQPTVASFIKRSRRLDPERTVLEAIKYKYGGESPSAAPVEAIIISGKVAEEVGFEKVAKEQAFLEDLKILVLENLQVNGVAPRQSTRHQILEAQAKLASTCPNVVELDLGYNTIDTWQDVCDICAAFPLLRVLRLNGLRLHLPDVDLESCDVVLENLKELQLNETLLKPASLHRILGKSSKLSFPKLSKLWLSQNEIDSFSMPTSSEDFEYQGVTELILENNLFSSLDCLKYIMKIFPSLRSLSFQRNKIAKVSPNLDAGKSDVFPTLESLTVSRNQITSFEFVDKLSTMLPNLTALRISDNPVYDDPQVGALTSDPSEISYYLTLARLPSLKILNFSQITIREREEGEIYYLSIAEREIKSSVSMMDASNTFAKAEAISNIESEYPRYQTLCEKYDRESVLTKLSAPGGLASQIADQSANKNHPAGSIAAQLIQAAFYMAVQDQSRPDMSKSIPADISTSQVFAIVARSFKLPALQFRLFYESAELDPVGDDVTTKSQLYSNDGSSAAEKYQRWGDWDADALIESLTSASSQTQDAKELGETDGSLVHGYTIKDGRRWKRREVEILLSFRSWGDWLDANVEQARIRVELLPD